MASKNTLTLPINEETQRKLRALAMLTGANVGSLEEELSGYLDRVITERCIELLGGAPTTQHVAYPYEAEEEEMSVPVPAKKRSFADAHKTASAAPSDEGEEDVEEAFSDLVEDQISGHSLSADEDPQENKSLEEQTKEAQDPEEETEFKAAFSKPRVKNVEDNAEAYLDATMGDPDEERETDEIPTVSRGYAGNGRYGERPVTATKSFQSRYMKGHGAKVQAYTGDEE